MSLELNYIYFLAYHLVQMMGLASKKTVMLRWRRSETKICIRISYWQGSTQQKGDKVLLEQIMLRLGEELMLVNLNINIFIGSRR